MYMTGSAALGETDSLIKLKRSVPGYDFVIRSEQTVEPSDLKQKS